MGSEAGIVMGVFSYVTALAIMLGMMGIGGVSIPFTPTSPTDPSGQATTPANGTTLQPSTERQGFISAVAECSALLLTATTPLFLFGVEFDCSRNTIGSSFVTVDAFFDGVSELFGMVKFALALFVFMWQLATFSIPEVPTFLSIILSVPMWIGIAFIGFKALRGTS